MAYTLSFQRYNSRKKANDNQYGFHSPHILYAIDNIVKDHIIFDSLQDYRHSILSDLPDNLPKLYQVVFLHFGGLQSEV